MHRGLSLLALPLLLVGSALAARADDDVDRAIADLAHPEAPRRVAAAYALARLGPHAEPARAALLGALGDADPAVGFAAAQALAGLPPEASTPAIAFLLDAYDAASPADRSRITVALRQAMRHLAPDGLDLLLARLEAGPPSTRGLVAGMLGLRPEAASRVVPRLAAALRDDQAEVRAGAAAGLGDIAVRRQVPCPEMEAAVPALVRAAADADGLVRTRAVMALGDLGPGVVPALVAAAEADDRVLRRGAVTALALCHEEEATILPVLQRVLLDLHERIEIRSAAAYGLGLRQPAGLRVLLDAVRGGSVGARVIAALALACLPRLRAGGLEVLVAALQDDGREVRGAAACALASIGPRARAAEQALLAATQDPDEAVRKLSTLALARIRATR